jgi:hypothetical protein
MIEEQHASHRATHVRRRRAGAAVAAGLLLLGLGIGSVQAKEIGSGTGGGGTVCLPITSLGAKSDPRVGELGFASIDVNYSVKPCFRGQTLTVTRSIVEYLVPANIVYSATSSSDLTGRFTVNGVKVRTTYQVTVTVLDVATQVVIGSQSVYTAAIPKGV